MQQDRVEGQDGRFLAAMLRRARCEDGADLADQGAAASRGAPAWSRKFFICADILPKRVGVPKMTAS